MAKTEITSAERLVKDCFIEISEQPSYQSSEVESGLNCKDRTNITPDASAKIIAAKSNIPCLPSEISDFGDADIINKTSVDMCNKIVNKQMWKESESPEQRADDKLDYDAESFCSNGSYKGSEVTNVTPKSSVSSCSSLVRSVGPNYQKHADLISSTGGMVRDENDDEELRESEVKYLNEDEEGLRMVNRRHIRIGRRNMSFTNDELRRIERENELLVKKIMSRQKPQNKTTKLVCGPPRVSSSAINRKRQQMKIHEDNMLMLRRIQQAKPCAIPRTSIPGCRLMNIPIIDKL